MARRFAAELFGTLVLVFFGCGAAVLGGFEIIGQLGIALAFGLAIIGFGPAVLVGGEALAQLWLFIIAPLAGAALAALLFRSGVLETRA